MEQTWRWFGPRDAVTLNDVAQTGATGIVTALHDIPYGVVWSEEAITERKTQIAAPRLGLRWSVVESLPIHEDIKRGTGDLDRLFGAYRDSLRNLARQGLKTVCYNFMPILDWTRTELRAPAADGGQCITLQHPRSRGFRLPDAGATARRSGIRAGSDGARAHMVCAIEREGP